jgi:hypothetical protein
MERVVGRASVILRRDQLVVLSCSLTPAKFYVANEFWQGMTADATDAELGAAVLAALAATRFDAPQPASFPTPGWLAVREFLGVRSEAGLMKGAKEVGVKATEPTKPIRCSPTRSTPQGFESYGAGPEVSRRTCTAVRLGVAVREALERSV